jgi:hypothetical protein
MHRLASRGFVYYELWIGLAVLVVAAIVVGNVASHRIQRARARAATAYIGRVAAFEHAEYVQRHSYQGLLPDSLSGPEWLVVMSADSGGWGIAVQGPLRAWITVDCGVFEGRPASVPTPGLTVPERIQCE